MTMLVIGLVIFLGVHSVRIFADDWRTARIARIGESGWKGVYALASLVGFALIVWGYGQSRMAPVELWMPPVWTRHLASLLMLGSFVLLVTAYVPGTKLKAAVKHPMVLGVKLWAVSHLIANGRLADLVLFGAFLVWAVADYRSARGRDRKAGTQYPPGAVSRDLLAVAIGVVAWGAFAFWLHASLIGVRPFG